MTLELHRTEMMIRLANAETEKTALEQILAEYKALLAERSTGPSMVVSVR